MSDRRSPPSHAGGDDAPTPPRGVPTTRAHTADDWDDDWDEPNYFMRRALVVAAVVASIAGVAVLASRFVADDDAPSTSTAAAAEWDTIVLLDDDGIRLLDRDSTDEIETYSTDDDLLDAQSVVAGKVLVTMTDEGRITQVDLGDGSQRRSRSGPDETLRISRDHPDIAISGPDAGGDVTIIDTRDRSTLSVAGVAGLDEPIIFANEVLVNPAGTHVAVPVPTAFQSVVIDLDAETSEALPGRVIAIDDERVVTEQPAGNESELEFYDLAGDRLGSVDIAGPEATLLRADGTLLLVAGAGTISIADADGSVDDVGTLVDPDGRTVQINAGVRVAGGERLLAVGGRRVFVLDADGMQLGVASGDISPITRSGSRCAIATRSGAGSTVLDVETGAVITEIDSGSIATGSYDGCTASIIGTTPQLLSNGEVLTVEADAVAAVAPDGEAYVVLDGRDAEYVRIGEQDAVEIGDRLAVIHFGQR